MNMQEKKSLTIGVWEQTIPLFPCNLNFFKKLIHVIPDNGHEWEASGVGGALSPS